MSAQVTVFRTLIPDDDLLRALLKKAYLENLAEAFLLREKEKESGLSVFYDSSISSCRAAFDRSYGVAAIKVESVVSLGLTIIPDAADHANIRGLPHKDDDPERAEWFASQLADRAVIVDQGKVEN